MSLESTKIYEPSASHLQRNHVGGIATALAGLQQVQVLVYLPLGGIFKVGFKANSQFCKHQNPLRVTQYHQIWPKVCISCSGREVVICVWKIRCDLVIGVTLVLEAHYDAVMSLVVALQI